MNTYKPILARKYAQAFINLYYDTLSIESISLIKNFKKYFSEYPNTLFYLQLNSIADEVKEQALSKIRSTYKLADNFDNLIRLLLRDKRIFLLPAVLDMIVKIYEEKSNTLEFTFSYAGEITDEQRESLQNFLEKKTGKSVIYRLKKDPDLIAGVKLYSDNLLWEYSVKSLIENLNA